MEVEVEDEKVEEVTREGTSHMSEDLWTRSSAPLSQLAETSHSRRAALQTAIDLLSNDSSGSRGCRSSHWGYSDLRVGQGSRGREDTNRWKL